MLAYAFEYITYYAEVASFLTYTYTSYYPVGITFLALHTMHHQRPYTPINIDISWVDILGLLVTQGWSIDTKICAPPSYSQQYRRGRHNNQQNGHQSWQGYQINKKLHNIVMDDEIAACTKLGSVLPGGFSEEHRILSRSNCKQVAFGFQSQSSKTLICL